MQPILKCPPITVLIVLFSFLNSSANHSQSASAFAPD
jgi:hypothetical protein